MATISMFGSVRRLLLLASLASLCGMPLAWAQTAPSWNYYTVPSGISAFLPFEAGAMSADNYARISTTINGSRSIPFLMDTGSTGISVSQDIFTNVTGLTNLGAGYIEYTSDDKFEVGTLYLTPISFVDPGHPGRIIATAEVPVLRVEQTCQPNTRPENCSPASGVANFGIGYDRGGLLSGTPDVGSPTSVANANPFLNLTGITGLSAQEFGQLRPGYVITNETTGTGPGVTLGITSALNDANFAFVQLPPNTASGAPPAGCPAPCTQWSQETTTVWAAAPGSSGAALTAGLLPDSGLQIPILHSMPDAGLPQGIPAPPGTVIQFCLPYSTSGGPCTASGSTAVTFQYTVSPPATTNPFQPVGQVTVGGDTYYNTSIAFYGGLDRVYDAIGGFVGYRQNGQDPANQYSSVNPILSLQGNLALPSNFSATYPVVLATSTSSTSSSPPTPTTLTAADLATFSGPISGAGQLVVAGGTVVLEATNTYTGGTAVTGGTVRLGPGGSLASTGALAVNGGTFDLNGHTQTVGALSGTGGTLMLRTGTLTAGDATNTTLAAAMTGDGGSFVKQGSGTLTLTATNTYTGGTTVTDGTLQLGPGGSLASTGALSVNGGTFDLNGNSQTVGALSGTGGTIMLRTGTLTAGDSGNTTLAAAMTGAGGSFVKQGSGTLVLTGANTHTGGTTITGGTLQLGAGGSLASTGALAINSGTFDLNGNNQTVGTLSGAGGAITLGSGTLSAGNALNATLASAISGSGGFVKQGSGTLTLTGANSYSGGTTVSGGVLQGTTESLQGNIVDNGVLVFDQSTNGTYAGVISGNGSVGVTGGGIVTFSGANSYSGGTLVSGATVQGNTSSLQGNITNNGAVVFTQTGSGIYAGTMSGTGNLAVQGGGTVILTAANTYSGGTTVSAGTLQLGVAGGATGSIAGNVVNVARLDVVNGSTSGLTISNSTASGNASFYNTSTAGNAAITNSLGGSTHFNNNATAGTSLITNNAGDTHFNNASTAGNATIASSGLSVTHFNDTSTAGAASITTAASATTIFNGNSTAGSAAITSSGTTIFRNSATAGGATITTNSGGLTRFQDTSTGGTARFITNSGATVDFSDLAAAATAGSIEGAGSYLLGANQLTVGSNGLSTTVGGAISGTGGSLTKTGTGTLILSGANSYTGGTTVSGGVLQGTTTSLQGNIVDNGILVFSQSTNGTYAGVISGSGSVAVTGGGIVTFTGGNTFDGGTTVSSGVLQGNTTSLQGNIANNGAVVFDQSGTGTYAGTMSGTGSLTIQGGGTLILSAAHSYSGGTIVSASTLQGNSSNLQGSITNNGTVVFNQTGSGTYAANMTGTGGLTVTGGGTLIMTGSHSYSGSTTVTGATLAGTTASLQGGILNNGAVVFDQATVGTYAGGMSGTGSLTKTGAGTVFMTGANSYSGGTTVSGGTLQGTTTSLQGNIANNAAVQFHQSTDGTFAGVVSGNGILIKSGAGTLTLTGVNVHTGGTAILDGTLRIDSTKVRGDILVHGALAFDQAVAGTYAGDITGNGSLTKSGAGSLVLSGSNDYRGGTTVSAGTLQGTTESLHGNILNNAAVVFDQPTNGTYAGNMSGTGSLTLQGGGLVSLTGNNSFTGGTTLNGGSVVANTSSLPGNVTNNGTIVFNQAGSGTYAGVMSGTGSLGVTGGGTVNLTGINTYTGPTTVSNGLLKVNGSITSDVTVGSSGMLGGSGTIFGNVANAGALSPGNSIGTVTVVGNFTQAPGGSFQAEVNGAGRSDRANVTGTATLLGGTVNVVVQPSFFPARSTFVLLNAAGGLTGTYAAVNKDFNAPFLLPSLVYDANNVYLLLQIGGFEAAAQTATQAAVGRVLDASAATASGDLATVLGNLAAQNSATVLPVLTAISGQNYSSLSTALVQTGQLFMNNFAAVAGSGQGPNTRRVALAEACDVACDSTAPALWGAWGGALGGLGTVGAGSSSGAVTYNAGGFAAGLDRKISPTFTAGVAVGYTAGTQWTGGFSGTSSSDTVQFGLYGLFNQGAVYLDGLAGYAYSANQMSRSIQIPGLAARTAIGQTAANQFFGQVETGYRFDLGGPASSFVTPFARLQGFTGTQNAFTESGAQSLNLNVAAQTTNSLRSVLGAQFGSALDLGWKERLAMQFRLGWSHEYANTARPVTAALGGAPTLPFTTYGVSPQRDGLLLGFSASTAIAEATSLFVRYEGTMSGQDSSQAVSLGVRMMW